MTVNPGKFHAMFFQKNTRSTSEYPIVLMGHKIFKTQESVTLLGVTINSKLPFEEHISNLCEKASAQLNAVKKLGTLKRLEPSDSKNYDAIVYFSALQLLPFSVVFYICEKN